MVQPLIPVTDPKFHFLATPSLRKAYFCKGGFGSFLSTSRQNNNLEPLDFFSKVPTKNQPFGFHFSKGTDNRLRVWILAIFGGGGGGGLGCG